MRVLVTGAGGFLGGAITRMLLARGDQVSAVQRSDAPALRALGVTVVRGDLAEPELAARAVTGCDAVLHVAAKAGHWGSYASYFAANVQATRHILRAAQRQGVTRLVYTSTPSVAHAGGDLLGVDESAPIPAHFHAHYPATKAIAETEVLAANSPHFSTCALRPHLIWGPGDRHLLPRLIARAKAGRLRFVGNGRNLVDTIYIENAARAHLLALERLHVGAECAGKAYFLSNDEPMALQEIVNKLIACAGLPPCQKFLPIPVAFAAGALMELAYSLLPLKGEPLMTRFLAEQLSTSHYYNISAAKRDLGYQAEVSIAEGLRRLRASIG
jgi:2-alkyl-3-oxoalkanoate reductase